MQRIIMFQQEGSGEEKIRAVREHGRGMVIVRVFDMGGELPVVIDAPEALLPASLDADLVLDHLRHPDLSHALAQLCHRLGIPLIAPGKHIPVPGLVSPPTCCGLAEAACPGPYAAQFGLPAYEVRLGPQGLIAEVRVHRGAPCAATWEAIPRLLGLSPRAALTRAGLEAQLFCKARPSSWDPIWDHSPVHFAGRVHAQAFRRALLAAGVPEQELASVPEQELAGVPEQELAGVPEQELASVPADDLARAPEDDG